MFLVSGVSGVCVFCVSGVALATDRDLSQDRAQQRTVRLGRVQQRTVEQLAVLVRAGRNGGNHG